MLREEIRVETEIGASPQEVWESLADFASYHEWNPYVVEGRGRAVVDERLWLRFEIPSEGERVYTPKVAIAEPGRELCWRANSKFLGFFVPGFLDREHYFLTEPADEGRATHLVHGERFSGLLVPIFRKSLTTNIKRGFEEMNRALKERAERW